MAKKKLKEKMEKMAKKEFLDEDVKAKESEDEGSDSADDNFEEEEEEEEPDF